MHTNNVRDKHAKVFALSPVNNTCAGNHDSRIGCIIGNVFYHLISLAFSHISVYDLMLTPNLASVLAIASLFSSCNSSIFRRKTSCNRAKALSKGDITYVYRVVVSMCIRYYSLYFNLIVFCVYDEYF